jgi:hypothetical protein
MMTLSQRRARIARMNGSPVVDDPAAAMAAVARRIDEIAIRRRAQAGWTPPPPGALERVIERVAEAAARHSVPRVPHG